MTQEVMPTGTPHSPQERRLFSGQTEPDSRALGSLFVDLEERRQPVNLAIDILDRLERHPNPVVKEFAARYVWPLQAGAKDRVGKKRWWVFHTLNDTSAPTARGEELTYEEWR